MKSLRQFRSRSEALSALGVDGFVASAVREAHRRLADELALGAPGQRPGGLLSGPRARAPRPAPAWSPVDLHPPAGPATL